MRKSQLFAGCRLDRAAQLRRDAAWVAAMMEDEKSCFLPVWRNLNLVEDGNRLMQVAGTPLRRLLSGSAERVLLGVEDEQAFFAIDLSMMNERDAQAVAGNGEFCDLRRVGGVMNATEAALAAYARASLRWHRYSRFCGHCGAATVSQHGGQQRLCSNSDCARQLFPRTDPAVIMLVVRPADDHSPARCLLANHHRSPSGSYSTLAGFVEPGESLEDAVVREVREEVGLALEGVSYRGSQPWPFPGAIMLGFHATTMQSDLAIDSDELADADWFSAAELEEFGEWGETGAARRLPPHDSIARDLIETWRRQVIDAGEHRRSPAGD
ncbi:MAG: NAD(+) diphosphatase [Gammaproteobacteria bacterium]|nr:NAD(+) diphosphatase [Gammaproteobacteria bacterium]